MVECATLPSNFKPQWRRRQPNGSRLKPQKSFPEFPRNCKFASHSLWSVSNYSPVLVSSHSIRNPLSRGSSLRYRCLGTMIDFETAAASDWVPVVDQVLLTASVFLTYMAGVIPSGRPYINSQKNKSSDMLLPESSIFFGSTTEKQDQMGCEYTWNIVKRKIADSLMAIENGDIMENHSVENEPDRAMRPLSLYAVANAPRLRLLLSSIERLEKEVNEIPDASEVIDRDEWLGSFSTILKKACQSAFISWMDKEFCTENSKPDKGLLSSMSEKLKGDDIILGNIRKSGKIDLYADLMGFLRYGFFRDCSYYDQNVYNLHGVAILEDLIITLADAIASMYMELMSVDSNISEKISNAGLSLCTLSTRALQKLRNEVAMCQWIHQNFGEIVLMYEDRFDLRVLKMEPYHETGQKHEENLSWWRKITLMKSVSTQPSLSCAVIRHFSLSLKRTREMRVLKGWRYYFSLLLELSDIAMPMMKAIIAQLRNAISFFLVSLIGRSVGLVYSGIRQSLRWK